MKVLVGLLLALLLALQYRLWFGDGSVQEVWRLNEQVRASKSELLKLRSRNQALEAEVADLKSGLDAIEERARTELGMIDEDETFYQFVRERRTSSNREDTEMSEEKGSRFAHALNRADGGNAANAKRSVGDNNTATADGEDETLGEARGEAALGAARGVQ